MRSKIIDRLARIYKILLSPFIHAVSGPGFGCRFTPTCSQYSREAFAEHTFLRALGLTLWRILRCQPFAKSGFDPVPRAIASSSKHAGNKR